MFRIYLRGPYLFLCLISLVVLLLLSPHKTPLSTGKNFMPVAENEKIPRFKFIAIFGTSRGIYLANFPSVQMANLLAEPQVIESVCLISFKTSAM